MNEDVKTAAVLIGLVVSLVSLATVLYRTGYFTGTWTRKSSEQDERIGALDRRHSTLAEETRTGLVKVKDDVADLKVRVAVHEVQVKTLVETINELKATKASEENLSGVRTAITEMKAVLEKRSGSSHR